MLIPAGYSRIAVLNGPKDLNDGTLGPIPTNASLALVQAETGDVRWRDDGTAPDASTGMILAAGDVLQIDSYLSSFKFINAVAGSGAKLNIAFYTSG